MNIITKVSQLPKRAPNSHKGSFGKVLIIGGSIGMAGAPSLAGVAALRSGSGLVRIASSKSAQPIVASYNPCYTTIPLAEDKYGKISKKAIPQILKSIAENDVIAFGPGCGISDGIKEILAQLIQQNIKLVIDADGLNNLAAIYNWQNMVKAQIILTPHPGEMKALWKSVFREPLPDDRAETASKFANQTNTVVVLKGAGTVVSNGEDFYINTTGNPGMATAGSGDVLTGIIVSLWGQNLSAIDSSVLAVYTHGKAGDIAAKAKSQPSVIATDIIDNIKF